jgi:opacity protein-like surface antigen
MSKTAITGAAILMFGIAAQGQEYQKMDTFLGYTYTRFTSTGPIPAFNANGGSGQWAYNFNKWFSGVVDAGAVHNGSIPHIHLDTTIASFLGGPRVSFRHGRVVPYVQTLFGGAYATTSVSEARFIPFPTPPGTTLSATKSTWGFAMTAGGGLDFKVSKHVNFRPIQAEYFLTRLEPFAVLGTNTQNNFRYSAGVNFTYGGAQ